MIRSVGQINEALAGFTDVEELSLGPRSIQGQYALRIILADPRGNRVILRCEDISGLKITDFGGGLSQFLCLRAVDIRDRQLDRVRFHFADKERNAIEFDCGSADVETRS
jgi:hypothetical protein